jgi:hypothetical protein
LETFSSLLAVSPRAGSENSGLRLSRGNRHGRCHGNSLRRDGNHTERKSSTRKIEGKVKIEKEKQDVPRKSLDGQQVQGVQPRPVAPASGADL